MTDNAPNELLIKGGHVVTVDPVLGDLPAGDVLVRDGVSPRSDPTLLPQCPRRKWSTLAAVWSCPA